MNGENEIKICSKCNRELPITDDYYEKRKESKDGFRGVCRECRGKQFLKSAENILDIHNGKKRCKQCKEYKDANENNFSKSVRNTDGFLNICKDCQIKNRNNISREGYKICKKCKREIPLDENHFQRDNQCLDGYRNVCFECSGGKFNPRNTDEWNQEEINILKEHYPYMSNEELYDKYFKRHTLQSMRDYATKTLKLCKDEKYLSERYWTEEQDQFLIENYASMSNDDLSKILNKSKETIVVRAVKYSVIKDTWWTSEEVDLLKKHYSCMRNIDLQQKYFPNRTCESVTNKAIDLHLKKNEEYLYDIQCKTIKLNGQKLYKYIKDGESIKKVYKLKGKGNPRYKERIKLKCAYCEKEIYRLESDILQNNNTFCSQKCSAQWKSENLTGENNPLYGRASSFWTEEMRRKQAKNMVKRLLESDFSYRKTKPQMIIDNLLSELSIAYENEYDCKYYLIDNYLKDYNLMIEVQGNFFHCNPTMDTKNSREKKIIGKDKAKHTFIKRYIDIEILYLWEKDIMENLELCRQLILEYINNDGVLESYHSFNYKLDENNNLKLIGHKYVVGY